MYATPEVQFAPNPLRDAAEQASQLLKAMANSDRLLLLCHLAAGERSVSALESALQLRQPSLSQQLTVLREAKLVSCRREGKHMLYQLASPAVAVIIEVLHREFCASHLTLPQDGRPF